MQKNKKYNDLTKRYKILPILIYITLNDTLHKLIHILLTIC